MNHHEDDLQVAVVRYLRLLLKGSLVASVPNGGKRNAREAARLKRMGVTAGVADVMILAPNGRTCFVEMKYGKGRQSPAQVEFQAFCEASGYPYAIVRSLDDVKPLLARWGLI
jgi:hypothetical protein